MNIILIILKKENGPALGLNTIIFKYVYWYMKQISGERLQDHWSSGRLSVISLSYHVIHVPMEKSHYARFSFLYMHKCTYY